MPQEPRVLLLLVRILLVKELQGGLVSEFVLEASHHNRIPLRAQLSGVSPPACVRPPRLRNSHYCTRWGGRGAIPCHCPSLTLVRKQKSCTPTEQCSLVSKSLHSRRSTLNPQSLNPNISGRASRSGWMGEAKRRNDVGDRKRSESPPEGHSTLLLFLLVVLLLRSLHTTPKYTKQKHIPAIGLCVGGTGWGDQQSAQGGSLHTPTTDHSTQLITALP